MKHKIILQKQLSILGYATEKSRYIKQSLQHGNLLTHSRVTNEQLEKHFIPAQLITGIGLMLCI